MQMVGAEHPAYGMMNETLEDDVAEFYEAAGRGIRGGVRDLETLKKYNTDLSFSFFAAIDDLANLKIRFGDTGSVRSELKLVEYYLNQLQVLSDSLNQILDMRYSRHDLKPSLTEGEVSRASAALNQTWARLLLAEEIQKTSAIESYLSKAEQYQETARRGVGFRGMSEVGWDRLTFLAVTQPGDWVARSVQIVEPLISRSRELNYRPGLIAGLTARGELKLEQGDTAGAESDLTEAVRLFEQYLQEADLSGEAEARAVKDSGRAYELLAGIRLTQGNAEGAFTLLDQRQQASASIEAGELLTRSTRELRGKKQRMRVLGGRGDQAPRVHRAGSSDPTRSGDSRVGQNPRGTSGAVGPA